MLISDGGLLTEEEGRDSAAWLNSSDWAEVSSRMAGSEEGIAARRKFWRRAAEDGSAFRGSAGWRWPGAEGAEAVG